MESFSNYSQDIPTIMEAVDYFKAKGITGNEIATAWHVEMKEKNWRDSVGKKIMYWKKYANHRIADVKSGKIHPKSSQPQKTLTSNKKEGLGLFAEQIANLQNQNVGYKENCFEKVLLKRLIELKHELQSNDEDIKQLCYKRCDSLIGEQFRIYNFLQALK